MAQDASVYNEQNDTQHVLTHAELLKCNSCGFCQAACPVYSVTRHEGDCARGHTNQLKVILAEPEVEHSLVSHFADCLTCRACTAHCPSAMQTDRVVVEARSRLASRRSRSPIEASQSRIERLIFRLILSHPPRMRRGIALLRLLAHTRPDLLLSIVRWLPLIPEGADAALNMLPRPRAGFLYERITAAGSRLIHPSSLITQPSVYFLSCGMNYLRPDAGEASLRVLQSIGNQPAIVPHGCCGLPAYVSGDLEAATAMARRNIEAFAQTTGPIISDCASCSSFLKEYPRLLGKEGEEFASRIRDFTEFVAGAEDRHAFGEEGSASEEKCSSHRIVTYHDPCHLSRYQKLRDEPRALLKSLPGIEYREMAEADWCCGGAGTYALKHPHLSHRILDRKMRNVADTKADILATACPGCLMQLSHGVKRARLNIHVMHVSELLAEAKSVE